MPRLSRWFGPPVILLLLSACGGQDPENRPAPPSVAEDSPPAQRSAPAEAPPQPASPTDPATDSVSDEDSLQQARAERERLRERGRRVRERLHWDEQALTEQLDLDADQFQALQKARQTLLQERVTVRTGLLAQRHFRSQAEAAGDTVRLEEIQAQAGQLRAQLNAADQTWQEALYSILDDDQLQRLAEQRPELLEPSGDR